MFISVVIPMFNAEKTISQTLNSIKIQTLLPDEVIIVNDGSKDNSSKIVSEFIKENDAINITLINEKNGGVSRARNIGIKRAKGKYIALLDADDEWHPKKIEIVNAMIDSKYNLYGHASTLDDFNNSFDIENNKASVEITFFDMLIKNRFVTPSVVFYNDQKFLFDEEMHHTEDHDLWLRMTYQKPALYINQKLVKLGRPVLSKGGASSDTWKMRKGELKMYINASKYSTLCKIILPILLPFSIFKFVKKSLIG